MEQPSTEKLKIAIAGGGIASLCLAHSLTSQHPQWEVKIFEASSQVRDEGAAIGLGSNSQEALQLISPSLRKAVDDAGGVFCKPTLRLFVGTGPNSGMHAGDIDGDSDKSMSQITVHRSSFWNELRKRIPDDVLEMGKRLSSIETTPDAPDAVQLTFTDGTTYAADALVGCDGINSTVRYHVLGADHPAAKPVYTNGYNHRVVVPLAEAEEAFGKEYCSLRTQTGWIGKGGFLLTDHNDNGASMQVIAGWSDKGPWPYEAPFVEWDKERLKTDFEDWGDIGKAMLKIFLAQPKLYAAGGRIHPPTPTYAKGPICLAGDAAQAFPPAQGAGAGQAIEDALMLSTVLGFTTHKSSIPLAFQTYDALRRPRRSAIAESSLWGMKFLTGRAQEVGVDPERIRAVLPEYHATILGYDMEGAQREALRRMGVGSGGGD